MNFERGQDPKESMKIGKKANPIRIWCVSELHHNEDGGTVTESFFIPDAQKLLHKITTGSKADVLFNIQDRNIILTDYKGNTKDIKHMWGEWVSLPEFTYQIPEFLKPKGASRS